MELKRNEPNIKIEKRYEYAGYEIRVYFNGKKTIEECIRNLLERKN